MKSIFLTDLLDEYAYQPKKNPLKKILFTSGLKIVLRSITPHHTMPPKRKQIDVPVEDSEETRAFEFISMRRAFHVGLTRDEFTPRVERAFEYVKSVLDDAGRAMRSLPPDDRPAFLKAVCRNRIVLRDASISDLLTDWLHLAEPYAQFFLEGNPRVTATALATAFKNPQRPAFVDEWINVLMRDRMDSLDASFILDHLDAFPNGYIPSNFKFLCRLQDKTGKPLVDLPMWKQAILDGSGCEADLATDAIQALQFNYPANYHLLDDFMNFIFSSPLQNKGFVLNELCQIEYSVAQAIRVDLGILNTLIESLPDSEMPFLSDALARLIFSRRSRDTGLQHQVRASLGTMSLKMRILMLPHFPMSFENASALFDPTNPHYHVNKGALLALPVPFVIRALASINLFDEPFVFRIWTLRRTVPLLHKYLSARLMELSMPLSIADRDWILNNAHQIDQVRDSIFAPTPFRRGGTLYGVWVAATRMQTQARPLQLRAKRPYTHTFIELSDHLVRLVLSFL